MFKKDFPDDLVRVDQALQDVYVFIEKKHFPDFPQLFDKRSDFELYMAELAKGGFISFDRTKTEVRWIARKVYLTSFLYLLHDSDKLKSALYSNNLQNLGKIAMIYFQVYIDKRTLHRGYYYRTRKDFPFIQK